MEILFTFVAIAVIILIARWGINSSKETQTRKNWDRYEQDYKDNHMEKYVNQHLAENKVDTSPRVSSVLNDEDFMEKAPVLDKHKVIRVLQAEIEKKLLLEARAEVRENPNRDDILQSQFVIHRLETYGSKLETSIFEDDTYSLTQAEISNLIHESLGNVFKVLFKGLI